MGRKIRPPPPPTQKKIPRVSNKIRKIPWTKKKNSPLKNHMTFFWPKKFSGIIKWHNRLYFIRSSTRPGYAETSDCFRYPQKPVLKSSVPPPPSPDKEECPICLPPKFLRSKISNQFNFLVHPRLPKSGVHPPPWDRNTATWIQYCLLHKVRYFHIFFVHFI